jgi:branched-chain amino acid transport system substrate-binding protein
MPKNVTAGKINRRKFLAATGAAAGIATVARPVVAQQQAVKIGLMTVKTGGLAAGGLHLEEGITCFLKDKNFTLAGRKIELVGYCGRTGDCEGQDNRIGRARQS